jgi:hypothetical protein
MLHIVSLILKIPIMQYKMRKHANFHLSIGVKMNFGIIYLAMTIEICVKGIINLDQFVTNHFSLQIMEATFARRGIIQQFNNLKS